MQLRALYMNCQQQMNADCEDWLFETELYYFIHLFTGTLIHNGPYQLHRQLTPFVYGKTVFKKWGK